MGCPLKPLTLLPFLPLLLLLIPYATSSSSSYTTLVYRGCARQALSDPTGVYSQAISSLFGTLISQSSRQRFFKASIGSGQTTINGLFQCRGDLNNVDCYNCISKLPILIDKLCGQVIAARVQLLGCYMYYQVEGFAQISGLELVYKTCGKKRSGLGNGFEEKRDTAMSALVDGVGSGSGFYASSYGNVYVLGQCEGDLGISDCGSCVKSAAQRSEVECGGSVSGQVYLDKCFVSYSYYPNGIPSKSSSFSNSFSSPSGQNPGKTVAIILGGALVVGFVVICLLFARSLTKKHDDY